MLPRNDRDPYADLSGTGKTVDRGAGLPAGEAGRPNGPSPTNGGRSGSGSGSGSGAGLLRAAGPATAAGVGARALPVVIGGNEGNVVRRTLNSILINVCQKGNPVISHIRTVAWEYSDIVPDYQVGATTGVLYLSLRYHLLHPEYIHGRIAKIGGAYSLRIMMVECDAENHTAAIRELTKICVVNGYTMVVTWSAQETARYLEIYKAFERKPPDLIKERVEDDYMSRLTNVLTTVKGVNKTDVVTLASSLGSFTNVALALPEQLTDLPGMGEKKVKRLREALSGQFVVRSGKKAKKAAPPETANGHALN